MKKNKMRIGKRYWMDKQHDVSGIYLGEEERGGYLFGAMNNNYCYLTDQLGRALMPKGDYEITDDLVTVISI